MHGYLQVTEAEKGAFLCQVSEGRIVTAADPAESTVTAAIDLASIDTSNQQRDDHIRSADFFEVESIRR